MCQDHRNESATNQVLVASIHRVEGFDPSVYAVDYTDLESGEVRKRIPIMPLLAWFRLAYPDGKIAVTVTPAKDCFVATARIYPSYKDGPDSYIGEATVSRGYCTDKPSVSPREWAQTAAIGVALRNAGFGLQFGMVGDGLPGETPDTFSDTEEIGTEPTRLGGTPASPAPSPVSESRELTLEEKAKAAMQRPCPIAKFSGKTLGEVLSLDPIAIKWIAEKYNGDDAIKAGALAICKYATEQADV